MFDPYHKWLGIPKEHRPPTHYQLLGISPTETDVEVIEEAAIRQLAHVRAYQVGPHAKECTQLLNELSAARTVLLNATSRSSYDAQLAKKAKNGHITATSPRGAFEGFEDESDASEPRLRSQDKKLPRIVKEGVFLTKPMLAAIVGGGVALLVAIVAVAFWLGGSFRQEPLAANKGNPQEKRIDDKGKADQKPGPVNEPPIVAPPVVEPPAPKPAPVNPVEGKKKPPVNENAAPAEGPILYRNPGGGGIAGVAMSPDGRLVTYRTRNGIELMDLNTRKTTILGTKSMQWAPVFSPDGSVLVLCDKNIELLHIATNQRTELQKEQPHRVAFSDDGKGILTGHGRIELDAEGKPKRDDQKHVVHTDCVAHLWDVASGKLLQTFTGHRRPVFKVAFAADGAVWTFDTGIMHRFDPRTGKKQAEIPQNDVIRVNFINGGRDVVGTGQDNSTLMIWNQEKRQVVRRFATDREIHELLATPDGRVVVARGRRPKIPDAKVEIYVWNGETGALLKTLAVEGASQTAMTISSDGKLAVSGCSDGTVRLWKLDAAEAVAGP